MIPSVPMISQAAKRALSSLQTSRIAVNVIALYANAAAQRQQLLVFMNERASMQWLINKASQRVVWNALAAVIMLLLCLVLFDRDTSSSSSKSSSFRLSAAASTRSLMFQPELRRQIESWYIGMPYEQLLLPSFSPWPNSTLPNTTSPTNITTAPGLLMVMNDIRGGGLGDQLGMTLFALALSVQYGALFVLKPLQQDAQRWSSFLMLEGEVQEHTLKLMFGAAWKFERSGVCCDTAQDQAEQTLIDARQQLVNAAAAGRAMTNTLVQLSLVQSYEFNGQAVMCDPASNKHLRVRYCHARVLYPLAASYIIADNSNSSIMSVAVHYRGGDLCIGNFDTHKCEPLSRLATSINSVQRVMRERFSVECVFHLFLQSPSDGTPWQQYLAPLTQHPLIANSSDTGGSPFVMWIDWKSEATYHAMVSMPVLIAGGSGFPKVATLYRAGVTVGRHAACHSFVCTRTPSGAFNEQHFTEFMQQQLQQQGTRSFATPATTAECELLPVWPRPAILRDNETFMEQVNSRLWRNGTDCPGE